MLMIIGCHLVVHRGAVYSDALSPINKIFYNFFAISGKIGVNIFILISGYFLIGKKFNLKRLINILLQTTFYAIILFSIDCIITNQFDVYLFFANLFPVLFDRYWFMTIYFLLMLVYPLLNIIIKNITKNQHLLIIIIGFILSALLAMLNLYYFSAHIIWFIILYFVAAYIKLYITKINKKWVGILLVIFYACGITKCIFTGNFDWYNSNTVFNFLISLCIFLLFCNMTFRSKIINLIATTTLGIYLIHDNQPYVHSRLWSFVQSFGMSNTAIFPLFAVGIILCVFIVCMLIEFARIYLIHKPLEKLYYKKIHPKLSPFYEKIKKKLNEQRIEQKSEEDAPKN